MPTNCKNCGAPLHGQICEYCGSEYLEVWPSIPKLKPTKRAEAEITVQIEPIDFKMCTGRDMSGRLIRNI